MTYRENDIKHENGNFFVIKIKNTYQVMASGLTCATSDSSYADLSLAIARCNYMAGKLDSTFLLKLKNDNQA